LHPDFSDTALRSLPLGIVSRAWSYLFRLETRAHELRKGLRPAGFQMRAPTAWQYIALR
jgi:hypothetical protein